MSHEVRYSVGVKHPDQPPLGLNPQGAGRCAHVVACCCGARLEGRGNTKAAAKKRAEIDHRKHVTRAKNLVSTRGDGLFELVRCETCTYVSTKSDDVIGTSEARPSPAPFPQHEVKIELVP